MTAQLRFTALFFVSTLAACGGKSFDVNGKAPDQGGSAGQGGSANVAGASGSQTGGIGHAGKSSTAGTSAGGTSTGGSGQGGGGPDACEAFDDDAGTFIQVEIANETVSTIYLGSELDQCAGMAPLFGVKDEGGAALVTATYCSTSCSQARENGPTGCPAICASPSVLALQPGESHLTSFSGLQYIAAKMPKECVTSPYGVQECIQAVMLEPGTFEFSSIAGSARECPLSSQQCGSCQPIGQGGCVINNAVRGGTTLHATTQAVLDASYGIYPRTLPPSGEAPPDDSGLMPAPRLRIVFSD